MDHVTHNDQRTDSPPPAERGRGPGGGGLAVLLLLALPMISACSLLVPGTDGLTPIEAEDAGEAHDAGPDFDAGRDPDAGMQCGDGLTFCDTCVDTNSDTAHCGDCETQCDEGFTCRDGACFDPVVEVSAAWFHTCARRLSGRVTCWGDNTNGQLGDGSVLSSATPVPVSGIEDAISLSSGSALPGSGSPGTTCVVRRNGTLYCWGSNHRGQLNDGTMDAQRTPVVALAIDDAVTVSNNFWGSCVSRVGADWVRCWSAFSAAPAVEAIVGFSGPRVNQVALAQSHGCAVEEGGRLACWGDDNSFGQLGDGTTDAHAAARTVISDAQAVAVGFGRSCGLHTDGSVSCWGRTGPIATPMPQLSPTLVPMLDDATALGGGCVADATCAIRADETVVCWGLDLAEQAASGGEQYRTEPLRVSGLSTIASLSVGRAHACAVDRAGLVWCWGRNDVGQLGNGTTTGSPTPVRAALQ
jgi:alpha-tubulin suppressor-like RCC1 family protein